MPYSSVRKVAGADFPTRWGHFRILGFEGVSEPGNASLKHVDSAVALTMGDLTAAPPLVKPKGGVPRVCSELSSSVRL